MSSDRYTILVIDDEVGPRESLRMVLKNGHHVLLADHVDQGLALLKEHTPDVVIMDIRMPGKNGIEGLREVRAIDPQVSVIMLTGYGALETAQEAIRLGASDYLKKPFDIKEIEVTVKRNAERTQMERRKLRALEDLKNLNNRLHEEVMLKERMASVGEASAEFAHDLRNPLTIVMGYCDLLFSQLRGVEQPPGLDDGETLDHLQVIEENVKRCYQLAEMWQKTGKQGVDRTETVALDELLREIVKSVEPLTLFGHEAVRYDLKVDAVQVKVDRAQLLRALHNIVTNAIHAVPERDGRIAIHCTAEGDNARVEITDNGSGIPEQLLERVFEPHFTTKPSDKGTGLGLSITRKIIEEHRGRIRITSQPEHGTTVTIHLPLQKACP